MDSSSIKVTIAGSECTIVSSTTTQIKCQTGSYAYSSTKALIQVSVKNVGLAINVINFEIFNNFNKTYF